MNKINYSTVCVTNIVITCLAQVFFDGSLFLKLLILPLVIILINIFFLLIKFELEFHKYLLSIYLGFFCSVIIYSFIILFPSPPKELPPGEIVLGADVIFIFWMSAIQLFILNLLIVIFYLFHRLFLKKWRIV